MAKKSGLQQHLYVDGNDLSGDVGAVNQLASPRGSIDATGLNSAAMERIQTHTDGLIDFNCFFNDAAGAAHPVLSALPTADVLVLYAFGGAIGDKAASLVAKQIDYPWSFPQDGSAQGQVVAQANGVALEYMEMMTAALDTFASASSATSIDDGASSSNGARAVVHINDIDSGTPTVVIEDSADDAAWATLISFTAVADGSEPTAERKTVTGTVDRYLRITLTGTFTNADIAVAIQRGTAQDIEDLS